MVRFIYALRDLPSWKSVGMCKPLNARNVKQKLYLVLPNHPFSKVFMSSTLENRFENEKVLISTPV